MKVKTYSHSVQFTQDSEDLADFESPVKALSSQMAKARDELKRNLLGDMLWGGLKPPPNYICRDHKPDMPCPECQGQRITPIPWGELEGKVGDDD